ncbi:MAG: cytochrome c-type biogenesis protein CcmH [Caldilineaceae bacterium]|nr:cytochrome c-type biogenesis protein CcmH [Caldilineaceae bacterium]MDE0336438.1 cytochrome c-type biogenesis protein CcmH [Caldilineaceae bacterium]
MASPLTASTFRETATFSTTLRIFLSAIFLLIIFIGSSTPLSAQSESTGITADEVNTVARDLWCPLCGGRLRLDSCELKACAQMREVIELRLAEGEDAESIRDYFLEQYGPQVLGEPPRQGFSWLAWILPLVAVAGGGVFLWLRLQQMAGPSRPAAARVAGPEHDERERRLEEELARYD